MVKLAAMAWTLECCVCLCDEHWANIQ